MDLFDTIEMLEKEEMAAWLAQRPRGPVVVDTCRIPRLAFVADPLCLVLRETSEDRIGDFRLDAGRRWDMIIVPSPASHWRFDPALLPANRIAHVNWIVRSASSTGTGPVLPETRAPRLLVATGGGGTPQTAACLRTILDPLLADVKSAVPHAEILQVAGPRLPAEGQLSTADRLIDVGSRLDDAFSEADAVVTTVGYNSILELAGLTTPALLVPIGRTFDDQAARAAQWAERLGLAHDDAAPERSAAWLASILARRQRRAAVALGPSGCIAAAGLILDLARSPTSAWGFCKAVAFPDAVAARASAAFRSGVDTPCAQAAQGHVVMPLLHASTLRKRLQETGAPFRDPQALAVTLCAQIGAAIPASLHPAEAAALSLKPFSPLAKVRSRLARAGAIRGRATGLAAACKAAIEECPPRATGTTVLHGDLHVGQLLVDRDGEAAVLDLDDLCMGDPEADLANFSAHLVTSPDLYDGPVATGFVVLSRALAAEGEAPCEARLDAFGSAALLRRALKVAEAGAPGPRVEGILDAVEALLRRRTGKAAFAFPPPEFHAFPHRIESGM